MAQPLTLLTALLPLLLLACTAEEPKQEASDGAHSRDTTQATAVLSADSSRGNPWLVDRYGPEHGIVRLEVEMGRQKTTQVRYFTQHGERDAVYWYSGVSEDGPAFVTITDNEQFITRGPGDSAATITPWRPDPNLTVPNFRNLTDEMRRTFALEELSGKTVLGKECSGYRLKIGSTISNMWVWEGVMLYGEIQGTPDGKIEPVIIRAVSLDTEAEVPETVFAMP